MPTCPRCFDLLPNDATYCAFCGCRVVEHAQHHAMTPGRVEIRRQARAVLRRLERR